MQRVNRSSAVPSLPAAPASPGAPGYFTGGNPALGQGATVPGYEWFNAVQEELISVIAGAGLTPNGADLAQLRKAMDRAYAGNQNFYVGNVTLTPDQAGLVYVDAGSGPRVITLPLANSCNGKPIRFFIVKTEGSANTITIQPSGGDTIDIGTPNVSFNFGGENVELISNGVTGWYTSLGLRPTTLRRGMPRFATAAEVDAGTLGDVAVTPVGLGIATRNYANPGYARLPGGLIMQWGVTNSGDVGTSFTATFPIAFPNAVLNLQGMPKGNGGNGAFAMYDGIATLTGCTFTMVEWAALVQNASVAYLAIGR
jgi:hypothetical protein